MFVSSLLSRILPGFVHCISLSYVSPNVYCRMTCIMTHDVHNGVDCLFGQVNLEAKVK